MKVSVICITARSKPGLGRLLDSLKEQTNAGLDQCTKEEFDEFNKLNTVNKSFEKISLENEDFSFPRN